MAERRAEPSAELSARRVVALGVGVLTLLLAILTPGIVGRDGDRALPPWYFCIVVGAVAILVGTGLLAPWLGPRGLRIGSALGVAGYVAFIGAFLPAALPAAAAVGRVPWMLSVIGVVVGAALLADGLRLAVAVIVLGACASLLYRVVIGGLDLDGIVNDTQSVLSAVIICAIGAHLLAVSRRLDAARADASAASVLASAERGRLAARTRAAALVHDEVLATLTLAGSGLPVPRDALARQAAHASRMVTDVAREPATPASPLRVALARAARDAGASFRADAAGDAEPPPAVEEAIVAAARQALDNSVRHAGEGARREVVLTARDDRVAVDVRDDGHGFDLAAVPPDRLGIATSIVRRMRDVPGGEADVRSSPGGGARVSLRWTPPAAPSAPAGRDSLRGAIAAIVVVFVVGQGVAAVGAALEGPAPWVPPLLLAGLLLVGEVLRRSTPRPTTPRGVVVVALTVAVVAAGTAVVPFTFGTLWFVPTAAFVLVALALAGRPFLAGCGQVVLVGVVIAIAATRATPLDTIAHVVTRPLVMAAMSTLLVLAVDRMRHRILALHRRTVDETSRRAWDAAARAELAVRGAALGALVVPLLDRIADARPLTDDDRRACLTVEGQLRDEYRAGVLVREPLTGAVRAARERGVDVVLLDDGDGTAPDDLVDEIARWMAPLVEGARARVVGRMLPPGRQAVATVVADEETTLFRGRGAGVSASPSP